MSYFPWLTILVVLPIFAGSLIFFLPHKGNKVVRWLLAYAFCYHFQLEDPLIQLKEDYKWIDGYWQELIESIVWALLFTNEHCYLIPTKEIAKAHFCQMGLESIEPRLKSTGESRIKVRRTGYVMRRVTWE